MEARWGGVRREALEAAGGWNALSLTRRHRPDAATGDSGMESCLCEPRRVLRGGPGDLGGPAAADRTLGHRAYRVFPLASMVPVALAGSEMEGQTGRGFPAGVYLTSPLILLGWAACLILFFSGQSFLPVLTAFFLASTSCNAVGNFASFFEIGNSVILDGRTEGSACFPSTLPISFSAR